MRMHPKNSKGSRTARDEEKIGYGHPFLSSYVPASSAEQKSKKSDTQTHTFTLQQHHDSKNAVKRHHMVMHMQLGLDAVQLLIA